MDVGASTGGFTDCLLRAGAAHVTAIDVGRGQLAWSLRTDPRVTVRERTNIRDLGVGAIDPAPTVCVADLSFISLRTVAPHLVAVSDSAADHVLLVKPQFEAGREEVTKGGVVRDERVHASCIARVALWCIEHGLRVRGVVRSGLIGPAGNREFFLWLQRPATAEEGAA